MKIKGVIITIVLMAAIIGAAVLGYNYLTKEYAPTQQTQQNDRVNAPDFTVTDEQGKIVSLTDFIGKPIVLNFWATWCGPCKMEMPYFQKAYEKYGNDVTFLMVNVDGGAAPTANVTEFLAQGGYSFPIYYDGNYSASLAYSVDAIPETVFITEDGYVSYVKIGAISENQLNAEIDRIIGEAQQ